MPLPEHRRPAWLAETHSHLRLVGCPSVVVADVSPLRTNSDHAEMQFFSHTLSNRHLFARREEPHPFCCNAVFSFGIADKVTGQGEPVLCILAVCVFGSQTLPVFVPVQNVEFESWNFVRRHGDTIVSRHREQKTPMDSLVGDILT
jgi:hypothetical protein